MFPRKLITLTAVAGTSLFLAACTGTNNTETTTVTSTASAENTASSEAASSSAATTTLNDASPAPVQGEDPVFSTIDAVLAEYSDGIITDIDREDSRETYDVDVVVGQEVIELEVDSNGEIRVDEREGDDDDIREANDATVAAAEAIMQALESHPDGVLDEIALNEDDGRLEWEIELDDADRNDLAELTLPAN